MTEMTLVRPDYAIRQERYTLFRRFIRDVCLRSALFPLFGKFTVEGLGHIPHQGGAMILYNHIHAADAAVIMGMISHRFAIPMSKSENFKMPFFGLIMRYYGMYPVDQDSPDRSALNNTIDLLNQGHVVLIAPEGTRNKALERAKDGAAYAAIRAGALIIPAAIEGTPHIQHNMKRLRKTPVLLRFGRPFRFRARGEISRRDLPPYTTEAMYQLAALLPEARRGHYQNLDQATTDRIEFVEA